MKNKYLSGSRILPSNISGKEKLSQLVEKSFLAYNSARLKEACRLFSEKMLASNVTVGLSLAGALTPAGLGASCLVPLINAGFVDWIVTTGANMYHDLHFALNCPLHAGSPRVNDKDLRKSGVVRIYDIFLGYTECLLETDAVVQKIITRPEFQAELGTQEFYYHFGRYINAYEIKNHLQNVSVLAAAYRTHTPIFTSAPADSSLGMDIAALEIKGNKLRINPSIDINESAAIVLAAKKKKGESAVVLIGGGSPKNFMLQTEPYLQEILKIKELGHDYFLQITDARPDTGGLSGATPQEAVSWGKVDPKNLPAAVVCYADSTIALPILTHYALAKHPRRKLKKLYQKREAMLKSLKETYKGG